jgi:hypothetical protein
MSDRREAEARTIHPRARKQLGKKACIVALGVARDLRSGAIPPEKFDMRWLLPRAYRGSACCIAGWMLIRGVKIDALHRADNGDFFSPSHPSDPHLAADAIERYVYSYSKIPWTA